MPRVPPREAMAHQWWDSRHRPTLPNASSRSLPPKLFREPNENPFRAADVAEPVHVLVLDHLVDDLGAMFRQTSERLVEVLHREHDAKIAESVHRGVAVIGDRRRREEAGQL